jgi:hypothetical protein
MKAEKRAHLIRLLTEIRSDVRELRELLERAETQRRTQA